MDNPERATRFYSDIFGWKIERWGDQPYWMVKTGEAGPGIDGGMNLRSEAPDGKTTVNTIDVPSIEEYAKKVEAAGGKIAVPKMPIGTMGWLAYCEDTEGNAFGLWETIPQQTN